MTDEDRVERLWSAATGTGTIADKTFFGGILDTRFAAEGLIDHVGKLMQRLQGDDMKIGDQGYTRCMTLFSTRPQLFHISIVHGFIVFDNAILHLWSLSSYR